MVNQHEVAILFLQASSKNDNSGGMGCAFARQPFSKQLNSILNCKEDIRSFQRSKYRADGQISVLY